MVLRARRVKIERQQQKGVAETCQKIENDPIKLGFVVIKKKEMYMVVGTIKIGMVL